MMCGDVNIKVNCERLKVDNRDDMINFLGVDGDESSSCPKPMADMWQTLFSDFL